MKKFSKIRRLGHSRNQKMTEEGRLLVKEKLDGAQFRWKVTDDGKLLFGSKNVEYKINGEPDYSENVDGRFKDAIDYVREKVDPEKVKEMFGTDYTFFGENMVKHSLEYDWENTPKVIGFDVYDHENDCYLEPDSAHSMLMSIGLEQTAPIVERDLPVQDFDPESFEVPDSRFRDGKAEGVVIINTKQNEDNRDGFSTRAKLVTDEFAEKHKRATGANQSREAIHGHEKVVSKYCTDARIRKHINKMRDEGRELGMELMGNRDGSKGLPMRVSVDILEEEADSIVRRNDDFDWKDYRDLVADRCVYILKQEILKNSV